jgi:hypothetical protein
MATITEVEKLAFDLPVSDRALLSAHLLRSLPSVLHHDDEGIASRRHCAETPSSTPIPGWASRLINLTNGSKTADADAGLSCIVSVLKKFGVYGLIVVLAVFAPAGAAQSLRLRANPG